jgi:hypothetical protein
VYRQATGRGYGQLVKSKTRKEEVGVKSLCCFDHLWHIHIGRISTALGVNSTGMSSVRSFVEKG